jgi:hypothetical protein
MATGTLMLNSRRKPRQNAGPLGQLTKVTKLIGGRRTYIMPPPKPRDLMDGTPDGGRRMLFRER